MQQAAMVRLHLNGSHALGFRALSSHGLALEEILEGKDYLIPSCALVLVVIKHVSFADKLCFAWQFILSLCFTHLPFFVCCF